MNRATRYHEQCLLQELNQVEIRENAVVSFLRNYNNRSVTENGAVGFRTTNHPLLDLNFKVASLRNREEEAIVNAFVKAYHADWKHAVKWLFFLRDILEGLGERRTFRLCLKHLAIAKPQIALAVMKLVPQYGRYDDLLVYLETPLSEEVCAFLKEQLDADVAAMQRNEPVSLLAKWLPGNNTSSKDSRAKAAVLAKHFGMGAKEYRKTLSALRRYLDVTEVKLSAGAWGAVNYEKVPAKANLKYDSAFLRHDRERRVSYIENAFLGDGKVNAKGLMPYEIVHRVIKNAWATSLKEDVLAELLWKKLLEQGQESFTSSMGLEDCIVVADGSGSMYSPASGSSSVYAIDVCNSLAIYFAEQLQGVFHNKVITFSERPQFVDLNPGNSLRDKLEILLAHGEVANTNIEAVFKLLLDMAASNRVPADQLPKQVLIISDMEFDEAICRGFDETLFESIGRRFRESGYTMPRLIFWNVCGRTDTIPMVEGENGICLLSGFSQNAIKVAANREIHDPYLSLLKVLDGERYLPVEEALQSREKVV